MNAPNTSGWKPEMGTGGTVAASVQTASGDYGLALEEPLIFELGAAGKCGVDFDEADTEPAPNSPASCARLRPHCPA